MGQSVIVVGSGIVGSATALALLHEGADVLLLDDAEQRPPASTGNAGLIAIAEYGPLASMETLRRVPRWLMEANSPLSVSARRLPVMVPWLTRYLLSCRPSKVERTTVISAALCARAPADHHVLAQRVGAGNLLRPGPALRLYRDAKALETSMPGWRAKRLLGIRTTRLDAETLAEVAPQLSKHFVGAVRIDEYYHYADPHELLRRVRDAFIRDGGKVAHERIVSLALTEGGAAAVNARGERFAAKTIVLAAGVWSAALARTLGDRIPIESERGHHIELPGQAELAPMPMSDVQSMMAITPMAGRLRMSAGVGFAGMDAPPDPRQGRKLERLAREVFPAADLAAVRHWMGHRPSTPDYLPVVGSSGAGPSVLYAFGHGHLGLTGSATTARIIAGMWAGRLPEEALGPDGAALLAALSPGRFRKLT